MQHEASSSAYVTLMFKQDTFDSINRLVVACCSVVPKFTASNHIAARSFRVILLDVFTSPPALLSEPTTASGVSLSKFALGKSL